MYFNLYKYKLRQSSGVKMFIYRIKGIYNFTRHICLFLHIDLLKGTYIYNYKILNISYTVLKLGFLNYEFMKIKKWEN